MAQAWVTEYYPNGSPEPLSDYKIVEVPKEEEPEPEEDK